MPKRSEEMSVIHRFFKCYIAKIMLTQHEWLKLEVVLCCQKEESFQRLCLKTNFISRRMKRTSDNLQRVVSQNTPRQLSFGPPEDLL